MMNKMKKKITIPAILAAVILVAGIFSLMPIYQASTIHSAVGTTAVPTQLKFGAVTGGDLDTGFQMKIECNADYALLGIVFDNGGGVDDGDETIDINVGTFDVVENVDVYGNDTIEELDLVIAAVDADDIVITWTLTTDNDSEDLEEVVATVISSAPDTCSFAIP